MSSNCCTLKEKMVTGPQSVHTKHCTNLHGGVILLTVFLSFDIQLDIIKRFFPEIKDKFHNTDTPTRNCNF